MTEEIVDVNKLDWNDQALDNLLAKFVAAGDVDRDRIPAPRELLALLLLTRLTTDEEVDAELAKLEAEGILEMAKEEK